jgi:hypothetical protein
MAERCGPETKYRGLSTARRTVRLSAALVEMTFPLSAWDDVIPLNALTLHQKLGLYINGETAL